MTMSTFNSTLPPMARGSTWFSTTINCPFRRPSVYDRNWQILESIFRDDKSAFSKVALVEYPRKGLYSLAFITSETRGAVKNVLKEELWSVFLPTTPNPTSGYLLFVPKKDAIILNIPVDQAVKLIMSAGVIDEKQKLIVPQERINIQKFMFERGRII